MLGVVTSRLEGARTVNHGRTVKLVGAASSVTTVLAGAASSRACRSAQGASRRHRRVRGGPSERQQLQQHGHHQQAEPGPQQQPASQDPHRVLQIGEARGSLWSHTRGSWDRPGKERAWVTTSDSPTRASRSRLTSSPQLAMTHDVTRADRAGCLGNRPGGLIARSVGDRKPETPRLPVKVAQVSEGARQSRASLRKPDHRHVDEAVVTIRAAEHWQGKRRTRLHHPIPIG